MVWIPAILLLLASVRVRAADADDAKAHYQRATAHFAVGEYREAAVEYEEAFKLKQDPAILFNAAQSLRLAGDNQKALLLYNNIIKLYPSTQYARDSRERIEKLAQSGTSPPTAMPPAPPAVAPPPVTPIASAPATGRSSPALAPALAPAPTAPEASPLVVSSAPPGSSEDHPIYTRWWFWTAAAAVAAGAAITIVAVSSGGTSTVTNAWNNLPPVQAGVVR
jgi:tetratricopeptide (TPR) repeat protein